MNYPLTLRLRDYQTAAIEAVERDLSGGRQRVAVVLPTGTGKTVTFAHLAQRYHQSTGRRVLVLAHRDELVSQAAHKLAEVCPDLNIGIVKAERDEYGADIVVASVQTLIGIKRRARIADVGMVIVDECHHATADTYMAVLDWYGCFGGPAYGGGNGAVAVGFTATLGRTDGKALGQVWEVVSFRRDIREFIPAYLLDAKGIRVDVDDLDLSGIKRSAGDYQDGALGDALMDSMAAEISAKAYAEHAADRQGILFAPTVRSAGWFADAFNEQGITTETVSGAMPLDERRAVLRRFQRGDTQVVSNCMVLTEGFDAPWASVAVLARPTSSAPLFVQMVGRVLRPYPGQSQALVLDVCGMGGRHQLATIADLAGIMPAEGETVTEALEREAAEALTDDYLAQREGSMTRKGVIVYGEFELFAASRSAWLKTNYGVWFLSKGKDELVFLVPSVSEPGRFSVGTCVTKGQGGAWIREDLDLDMAMSFGEQVAMAGEMNTSRKDATWRKSAPSDGQRNTAGVFGVTIVEGMSRGDVSDLFSIAVASSRIDRMDIVKYVKREGML